MACGGQSQAGTAALQHVAAHRLTSLHRARCCQQQHGRRRRSQPRHRRLGQRGTRDLQGPRAGERGLGEVAAPWGILGRLLPASQLARPCPARHDQLSARLAGCRATRAACSCGGSNRPTLLAAPPALDAACEQADATRLAPLLPDVPFHLQPLAAAPPRCALRSCRLATHTHPSASSRSSFPAHMLHTRVRLASRGAARHASSAKGQGSPLWARGASGARGLNMQA